MKQNNYKADKLNLSEHHYRLAVNFLNTIENRPHLNIREIKSILKPQINSEIKRVKLHNTSYAGS